MEYRYFNNAGSGIMSNDTFDTIVNHMRLEMQYGAYKAAIIREKEIKEFYKYAAKLLNAESSEEIAFIDSASRGWNLVMYGLPVTSNTSIVTLESEYGTNLLTIYDIANKTGCSVTVVKCHEDGSFDLLDVEDALSKGECILAVSHVAAQGAIENPVNELGILAEKYKAIYIVDGCQACGQIPINVQEMKCDFYITAGRKWLCGPRGTGILYVKKESRFPSSQIDLSTSDLVFDNNNKVVGIKTVESAKRFELWEKNVASLLGLSNAIKECLNLGLPRIQDGIISNTIKIREAICNNPKLTLVGKKDAPIGNASFYTNNEALERDIKVFFEENGFIISCMCDWDCPLFFPKNNVKYIFRITPHYYTPSEEVHEMCECIRNI